MSARPGNPTRRNTWFRFIAPGCLAVLVSAAAVSLSQASKPDTQSGAPSTNQSSNQASGKAPSPAPTQGAAKTEQATPPAAQPAAPVDPTQAQIIADTAKLVKLSQELKDEVAKSNKDTLSLAVIKKAEEVEKLAKSLKERMNKSH